MFFAITLKEIRLNAISFRFQVSMTLFFVLILGSMYMMSQNYTRRQQDFDVDRLRAREHVEQMMHPFEFMGFGRTWPQRPKVLGVFSSGLEQELSRPVTFSPWKEVELGSAPYSNPLFLLFQTPDFVYVVNIVLSLLAILFAFDAISGEKENQTLKLMLTNAVPRDVVILGKWVGGLLTIWVPFLLVTGLGLVIMRAVTGVPFQGDMLSSIALLVALSLGYVAVFFGIGMLFSSMAAKSSTSLILSLFAWVFFVLVVPNVAPIISRKVVSLPSPGNILLQRRQIEMEVRDEMRRDDREGAEAFSDFQTEVNNRFRLHLDAYDRQLSRQVKLAKRIAMVSPSSNFILASSEISGTGISEFDRLKRDIRTYKDWFIGPEGFVRATDEKKIRDKYPDRAFPPAVDAAVFEDHPFVVRTSPFNRMVATSLPNIIMLFLCLVATFLLTYVLFMRYDVR